MRERFQKYNLTNQKISFSWFCIWSITISTIIQGCFGYSRDATDLFKAIIAFFCWASLFFSALRIRSIKKDQKELKLLLGGFGILLLIAVISTIIYRKAFVGNTYVVMLTNMYGALNVFVVLFMLAIRSPKDLRYLYYATLALIIAGIFMLYFNYKVTIGSYYLSYILVFAPIFMPYLRSPGRTMIIIGILLSLFSFLGGSRMVLFSFAYNLIILVIYRLCKRRTIFIGSVCLMIIPFAMLVYSVFNGSILETLAANFTDANDFNVDTRTFLYTEFIQDFMERSTFVKLFGQGTVAYYYSSYFDYGHTIGTSLRFGIEIPMFQQIMQCGLIYFGLVVLSAFLAIKRYYKYGRNSFSKIASLLIASYFCMSFMTNYSGCNIEHLGYWALIGCAYCDNLITMPDKEIKRQMFPHSGKSKYNHQMSGLFK